ncbi:hypothetical protein APUTEX25_001968 [Auxenochlorella protothecoides]|uniref:Mitochondrial substrate carrier family protein B n=1 Tax=Auxenochlorella protothecoides TaxID=3075 RepID=A0A3M7KYN6_AUXPR|nr:hypothetical protein APUTEX25_001968 [Auxenochlorella protothecoides]|eukprot:RMZ54392.1 hypothetical protein APUTEX25_001968 [Auxenochlorella protothecoides]
MAFHHGPKWTPQDLDAAALTGNEGAEVDMERVLVEDEGARLLEREVQGDQEGQEAPGPSRREEAIEVIKLLTSGGLAGAISKTATAPLARLTILYQVKGLSAQTMQGSPASGSVLRALREMAAREGLSSLWRGNGVTIVHRLPYSAANFWVYEQVNEQWKHIIPAQGTLAAADVTRRFVAGGIAGLTACTLAYPLDLVRTRLAAQVGAPVYSGIGATLAAIVREGGARGLYRGLGATLAQTLRSAWLGGGAPGSRGEVPSVPATLACGSLAGLVSSTATFPLDLVRRRLQLQGAHGAADVYASYAGVFRSIAAREGLRGFYAGILPEYYKVVPGVAIAFCSYELMKRTLGVQTNATQR